MAASWNARRLRRRSNYWRSAILLTAAHLDVFTWFGSRRLKARAAAAHYGGEVDSWAIFLNALCSMGLLRRQRDRYFAAAITRRHLTGQARALLLPDYDAWSAWANLAGILTTAKRPPKQKPFATDRVQSARLLQALDVHARKIAPHVTRGLRLKETETLLDVGGGLGTFACVFCRRHPRLRATLVEHPNIAPLARRAVRAAGLAQRIRVVARDFTRENLPGGFDAVFVSNILHAHSAIENRVLLRQVHRSLNPGGQLILREVFMDREHLGPPWAALFSVALLLHTPHGRCYSREDIRAWLHDAGFSTIQALKRSSPLSFDPDGILIARKSL
ncbi:MAG TPA: methyltransferase [Terriglobales bacterium]|jgi:precorrin-6B methylase 2|nr:methyltransferase [Terriglobales bacterium]